MMLPHLSDTICKRVSQVAAGKQRRVHVKARVVRGGPDQAHDPPLDVGQQQAAEMQQQHKMTSQLSWKMLVQQRLQ